LLRNSSAESDPANGSTLTNYGVDRRVVTPPTQSPVSPVGVPGVFAFVKLDPGFPDRENAMQKPLSVPSSDRKVICVADAGRSAPAPDFQKSSSELATPRISNLSAKIGPSSAQSKACNRRLACRKGGSGGWC
jgi:hypothetical protein